MGLLGKVIPDLKGRLTGFILEYLGQYLEGLDRNQLRLKLWQGDLVVRDVKLRAGAFDELLQDVGGVPLALVSGTVDSLHLKVPWSSLKKESVVVTLTGVRGVVAPCRAKPWDEHALVLRRKEAALARWEARRLAAAADAGDEAKDAKDGGGGWADRLKGVVLENLQIQIHDVHFRCEDVVSVPNRASYMGVTLGSVGVAATTAGEGEGGFVPSPEGGAPSFKLLHLRDLAAYVIPDTDDLAASWSLAQQRQTPAGAAASAAAA
eukprot:Rhum_TRINITY_DN15106_c25_g1::Rhum_TRINITY_DN15106_c25_g1_i1::g.139878::m.139878